jgi:hypothetical protein
MQFMHTVLFVLIQLYFISFVNLKSSYHPASEAKKIVASQKRA